MKYQSIKKYKYRLAETLVIQTPFIEIGFKHEFFVLKDNGSLVINLGYLWDGVSGPTWDTPSTMIPGLIHDAFYQAIRLKLIPVYLKGKIDEFFYVLMIKYKVLEVRAKYFYQAVKVLGHSNCVPGDIKIPEVIEV